MLLVLLSLLGSLCWALEDAQIVKLVNGLDFSGLATEGDILSPLLTVRTSGSLGIEQVRQFLVREFKELNYTVHIDAFTADTPLGDIPMANIIAQSPTRPSGGAHDPSLPPPGTLFGAHYDSKMEPVGMVGAIDSSVPCAVLVFAALALQKASLPAPPIDFVFFDGEEAIESWTDTDSLYGARHFVESLELPPGLVLLDLLGAPNTPPLPSWFAETYSWHRKLVKINQKLLELKLISRQLVSETPEYHRYAGHMLDDHTPFWKAGVPCLHFIPPRFPPQWHTINDNADNLDPQAVRDWAVLVTVWLAQYQEDPSIHDEL